MRSIKQEGTVDHKFVRRKSHSHKEPGWSTEQDNNKSIKMLRTLPKSIKMLRTIQIKVSKC